MKDSDRLIVDRIRFQLVIGDTTRIRTGNRRTPAAARKLAKAAAAEADIDIDIETGDGYVEVTARDR